MDARGLISKLRDANELTFDEAYWIGLNISGSNISDAQVGAFAMAVRLNEIGSAARVGLTKGMTDSGEKLTWNLPGPVLDKHSTGGVGDPVSLILAPALAACGAYVPMISGRGLGHTGGTLDKLEAIPGYICDVSPKRLNHVVTSTGCAIVGAGARVAPSDKRLYAIRDVTGTVNSIDLITASILSKKLAAGLDGLVLDVKTGSGAFMADPDDARKLANSLVEVANGAGCATTALITDMSQPLARSAGNALEVRSVMDVLTGGSKNERLLEVTVELGAKLLVSASLAKNAADGRKRIEQAINSGAAVSKISEMIAELGGPRDFAENWRFCLPEATIQREVNLGQTGYVSAINTLTIGEAVVALGGGRLRESDKINHAVGVSQIAELGQRLDAKTPIAMLHANDEASAAAVEKMLCSAFTISPTSPENGPLVLESIVP